MVRGRARISADGRPISRASRSARRRKNSHSSDALIFSSSGLSLIDRDGTTITPHLQLNQFMFLLFQSVRKSKSFFGFAKARNSTLSSNGEPYAKIEPPNILSSQYLSHKFQLGAIWRSHSRTMPVTFLKRKMHVLPNRYNSGFSKLTIDSMHYLAPIAWRRLSSICSYGYGSTSQRFIARAITLAFSRSHLPHSIFALAVGKGAWTQKAWADAGHLQKGSTPYIRPHDHHIHITYFLFSIVEGVILLLRAVYLAILFAPVITVAPFSDCFGPQFRRAWLYVLHLTLETAGPAFMKWGQWAATRSDLFPRDLCTELARLQTKAPAHKFHYTRKAIENAFGRKISEIFEDFEEVPVASGSIAQVHRATLRIRYPGRSSKPIKVAVKVRHPGVGESIRRDFMIIDLVAKISYIIPTLKWLRLDESVQQFAVSMLSQIDLAKEAAYLSHFLYNFRRWKDVSFPKPLYPFVHPAVLVETYEHGKSVSHFVDEPDGDTRVKTALAHIGTHALLKMLLVDNFIHADMHPGNILVRVSKRTKKRLFNPRPHVIFLDVGMTAELSKNDHQNLLEFFKAVALRDGRTAAECALRLSKKQNCPDPKAFIEEVTRSFDFWGSREGDVVHPAECMQQLLEQVRRHRVNIDGNVCMVMVTVLVLEGWQRKLDPEYNVMRTLRTLLLKADWAKSLSYTIEGLMAP